MVYELKTKVNDASVIDFLHSIENEKRKEDALKILDFFNHITGEEPKMWWSSIIGYGTYTYKYASGQTWDWMRTGFSPRKSALTLYVMPGYEFDDMQDLMEKLGKYKTGKSCLYIKKLEDIDMNVLEEIVRKGLEIMKEKYG